MKHLIFILFIIATLLTYSQTVIEMEYIEDADIVLREVNDTNLADIIIYRAEHKSSAKYWDSMWYFKKWGFSNFSIYIIKENEPIRVSDTTLTPRPVSGNVYFTNDYKLRGYRGSKFHLDGVMKINHKKLVFRYIFAEF